MSSLFVFLIPLIIGTLTYFFKLKDDKEPELYKRPTFIGWTVIFLTLVYLIFGVSDMVARDVKDTEKEGKITTLTLSLDSLIKDTKYIQGQNQSYYTLLTALGYKLDTTQKQAKKNIDSLLAILNTPQKTSNSEMADLDVCIGTENLNVRHGIPLDTFNVDICNGKVAIREIKLKWVLVGVRNGVYRLAKSKETNNNPYLFNVENGLPPNGQIRGNAPLYKEYLPSDTVFLYINGTYRDVIGKKYKLMRFYFMDNGKIFFLINEIYLEKLKSYLHKEKIL